MINTIGASPSAPPPPPQNSTQSLSDEQKTTIEEILSDYDSANLSESDAKSIVESFKEAGIEPGQAFAAELANAGFDARSIGDLAGVGGGQQPPPPSQGSSISSTDLSSVVDYLETLFEEGAVDLDSATRSEDLYNLLAKKFDIGSAGNLVDVKT